MALDTRNFYPIEPDPRFKTELDGVLTVNETAERFHKSPKGVMLAIYTGRLYAEKRDSPEGAARGVWLVSFSSASALWGDEREYVK